MYLHYRVTISNYAYKVLNKLKKKKKKKLNKNVCVRGSPDGPAVWSHLWPRGVILETQDPVPHRAPCMEPASPSAWVSVSLMNK